MVPTSQFRRTLPIAIMLTLGGASVSAAPQTDEADLAALRAQFDQIRTLVEQFDERLNALEARQRAAVHGAPNVPPVANGAGPAGASVSGAPQASVAGTPSPPAAATRGDPPTTASSVAPTTATPDRHSWRQVTSGATQADVGHLLGQPTKTFQLAGKTVWYYYYPAKGAGSVFFDSAGHVSSVQSPSTGW